VRKYVSTHHRSAGHRQRLHERQRSSRFDCDEADKHNLITQVRNGVPVPGLRALEQWFGPAR